MTSKKSTHAELLEQVAAAREAIGASNEVCGLAMGVSREAYRLRERGAIPFTGAELALLARQLYRHPLFAVFPAYQPTPGELALCAELQDQAVTPQ